jgi:hypothetical protein
MERTNYTYPKEIKRKKPIGRETKIPELNGEVIFDATDEVVEIDAIPQDEWERGDELKAAKLADFDSLVAEEQRIAGLRPIDVLIQESIDNNDHTDEGSQSLVLENSEAENNRRNKLEIAQLRVKAGAVKKEMGDIAYKLSDLKMKSKKGKVGRWLKKLWSGETDQATINIQNLELEYHNLQKKLVDLQASIEVSLQKEVDLKLQSPRRGVVSSEGQQQITKTNEFVARKVNPIRFQLSEEKPSVIAERAEIIRAIGSIGSIEQKITNDLNKFLSEFSSKFNIVVDQDGKANFDNFDLNQYLSAYEMIRDKSNIYQDEIENLDSQDLSSSRKEEKYAALMKATNTLFKVSRCLINFHDSVRKSIGREKAA